VDAEKGETAIKAGKLNGEVEISISEEQICTSGNKADPLNNK
jgi:hypothetical protein